MVYTIICSTQWIILKKSFEKYIQLEFYELCVCKKFKFYNFELYNIAEYKAGVRITIRFINGTLYLRSLCECRLKEKT